MVSFALEIAIVLELEFSEAVAVTYDPPVPVCDPLEECDPDFVSDAVSDAIFDDNVLVEEPPVPVSVADAPPVGDTTVAESDDFVDPDVVEDGVPDDVDDVEPLTA